MSIPSLRASRHTPAPPVLAEYVVEGLTSFAATLQMVGIFFYTANRFGWDLASNFKLAAGQGVVYVAGALLAGKLVGRFRAVPALAGLYVVLAAVTAAGAAATAYLPSPVPAVVAVLLAYSFFGAMGWPILEGMVSVGVDAHALSRRIAVYNFVWAGTGAAALAVNGAIIEHWPLGVFILPTLLHAGCAAGLWLVRGRQTGTATAPPSTAHVAPEPELLRVRGLALLLSRIALPATYIVIYSLSAMLPSLPVMRELDVTAKTVVGSAWLVARWGTFLLLGLHPWWHTRPSAMLAAAALMLVAFVGMTLRPSTWWAGAAASIAFDLTWMIAWQLLLGAALGLIYFASLYFGMVLSDGSTEHGGYHEALIGLGQVCGPAVGVLALWVRPGDFQFGVLAVSGVVAATVAAAGVASAVIARRREESPDFPSPLYSGERAG